MIIGTRAPVMKLSKKMKLKVKEHKKKIKSRSVVIRMEPELYNDLKGLKVNLSLLIRDFLEELLCFGSRR